MAKFAVYQFHISREAVDKINALGWDGDYGEFAEEVRIQRDVKFSGSEKYVPSMSEYFEIAATLEAKDLDDVFKIGNVGPTELVVRHIDRMHSVSIGDIIENVETGECFMVDPEGFTEIEFLEVA